ncbi:hypothetical protein PAXINDRAFT_18036 [Paxillus involutus ATCC 200175]|uniref:Uncharacterized protein n=1 Tax=Paxillus involutus ATCC 200175 TaxID=664439 RepID=A0A0C9TNQ3_PAXIN|nr:hypothetical protein PAXINDRAFT_18036 [Paxillus involutus ATCC 200175]
MQGCLAIAKGSSDSTGEFLAGEEKVERREEWALELRHHLRHRTTSLGNFSPQAIPVDVAVGRDFDGWSSALGGFRFEQKATDLPTHPQEQPTFKAVLATMAGTFHSSQQLRDLWPPRHLLTPPFLEVLATADALKSTQYPSKSIPLSGAQREPSEEVE